MPAPGRPSRRSLTSSAPAASRSSGSCTTTTSPPTSAPGWPRPAWSQATRSWSWWRRPPGLAQLAAVHDQAFGRPQDRLRQALADTLAAWPDTLAMVLALAGDEPVSAARAEFLPGREFAGLWGGGTVPAWRGRGLYRALTGFRARLAADQGYRYLQVDALPTSQPILARLGFSGLARTTPYSWEPAAREGREGVTWSS